MVDEGFLTLDQLSAALAEQDRSGLPLGKVLVQLGFVSEGAVANALAEQHGGLLKTEFGISAGLGAHPKVALVSADTPAAATPAAPVPQAVVTERDALAKTVNELQARLSESAQVYEAEIARVTAAAAARIAELEAEVHAHEAEVARVTAAAVAHITKLETEVQAALAARSELETTVRLGATRLSELQHELAEMREAPVVEAAPVEHAHLLLTSSPDGYRLMEWPGPAPVSGTLLDVDGVRFVVLRIGSSPLPGTGLRCVFLERA